MNPALPELLLSAIREQGPLPFDDFMGKALYQPGLGFYASGQTRTGKKGDFLTPVSTGPVLGELLARQADQLHEVLGRPSPLHLVEQGADAGWLARDLLLAVGKHHPELARSVRLHLIEPHAPLEQRQRQTLGAEGLEKSVQWHSSWDHFPQDDAPGFFYSCELVDSFPVKIFQFVSGSWREKWVGTEGARFQWQDREVKAKTLAQIRRWCPPEAEGYTLELRPGTAPWVQSWSGKIPRGLVLTMDYGFPSAELFSPARPQGTLVAIQNHQRIRDPLADPGQVDLTAHVNFTELEELGAQGGFRNYGLTDFARGLTALATPRLQKDRDIPESWVRNFRHLTHPSLFGYSHKILVQGKSLPKSFTPSVVKKLEARNNGRAGCPNPPR